jgi:tetratricopeptide (TPR) repeat protein
MTALATSIVHVLFVGTLAQGAAPAAPAAPAPLAEAYVLFLQGQSLEDAGKVDEAIAAYRKALAIVPRAAEIHAELSAVYARSNRANESVAEAQAALAIDPANREANRILGLVQASLAERTSDRLNQKSLRDQAIGHLERAIAGNRDPFVELALGRLYVGTERYQQGVDRLHLFLLDRPGYPEALMLLANAYEALGRPADAARAVSEILESQPDLIPARTWLAQLYEKSGRWTEAATMWSEVAARAPRSTMYRTRQASALVNGGDLDGGRRLLTELTTQTPTDATAWFLLAEVERQAGRADAAEAAARRLIALAADDARGPLALAGAQSARGDYKGAVATLEPRVTAAADTDVSSGLYARLASEMATAMEKSGDRARAVGLLERARVRDPENESIRFSLAGLYERDKQFDRAERLVRELVEREPRNADALNYLGYLLADRGQKLPEAVSLIQRALAIETDNPSFLDSLGWAYFKQSRLEDAQSPLERAAAALPRNSVILDHLGDLYFQLRRYRDAAAVWDRALAGDRDTIDIEAVTKKRDRARELVR